LAIIVLLFLALQTHVLYQHKMPSVILETRAEVHDRGACEPSSSETDSHRLPER